MNNEKPFSQACENNKEPILQVISKVFNKPMTVWEIGSGTGQHASYFAQQIPQINWQPTDKEKMLPGISLWVEDAQVQNLYPPIELDITDELWPCTAIEGLFTANTLHILSWNEVEILFSRLNEVFRKNTVACIYGPFNYHGTYTSESNERFDQYLKETDPLSGIRDKEVVESLAQASGIQLVDDVAMPANNRLLVFKKT
jgi:hypothetical protein